jgi:hypothetical protein
MVRVCPTTAPDHRHVKARAVPSRAQPVSPVVSVAVPKVPFPLVPRRNTPTRMSPVVNAVNVPVASAVEPGVALVGATEIAGVESDSTVSCLVKVPLVSTGDAAAVRSYAPGVASAATVRTAVRVMVSPDTWAFQRQAASVAGASVTQGRAGTVLADVHEAVRAPGKTMERSRLRASVADHVAVAVTVPPGRTLDADRENVSIVFAHAGAVAPTQVTALAIMTRRARARRRIARPQFSQQHEISTGRMPHHHPGRSREMHGL